jgi:hypothetical protein
VDILYSTVNKNCHFWSRIFASTSEFLLDWRGSNLWFSLFPGDGESQDWIQRALIEIRQAAGHVFGTHQTACHFIFRRPRVLTGEALYQAVGRKMPRDCSHNVFVSFNFLKQSGYFAYKQVEHSLILYSAHTVYLCVLCGSENKQRLFHCTALTDWFL